jgi:hypothetical protein
VAEYNQGGIGKVVLTHEFRVSRDVFKAQVR